MFFLLSLLFDFWICLYTYYTIFISPWFYDQTKTIFSNKWNNHCNHIIDNVLWLCCWRKYDPWNNRSRHQAWYPREYKPLNRYVCQRRSGNQWAIHRTVPGGRYGRIYHWPLYHHPMRWRPWSCDAYLSLSQGWKH